MMRTVSIESYVNYKNEPRFDIVNDDIAVATLTRAEAELLAADLIRALSTSDRAIAADSGMHVDDRSSRLTSQGHYDPWI